MGMPEQERGEGSDKEVEDSSIARIPIKHFGDYNLIGRLGFGGMAEVFLAFTAGPGGVRKLCVVKRLHRHLRHTKDFVGMFLDEARLAARLNHPNVVQTYELGEIDGAYFIAMEHLQGQSLDRIMRLRDKGDPKQWYQLVARVVVDALEGLHYAHELKDFDGKPLNIIHRDISPQNIFVTYEGITKVLDFGVAKAATQLDSTESGVLKGKCSYVAPEQAYGEKVDRRADLWAMGVVLWEALTGRRLFKAKTNAATLLEVLTAQIPLVMDMAPGVSLTLGQVVEKALQRKPDKRYATANQMKKELDWFFREIPDPISREQVGAFVSEAFSEVRSKQAKAIKQCLADALASRLPRSGLRTPKSKYAISSSITSLNFDQPTTADVDQEIEPIEMQAYTWTPTGDVVFPAMTPTSTPSGPVPIVPSSPMTDRMASPTPPSLPSGSSPGLQSGPGFEAPAQGPQSPPRSSRLQKILLGATALLLAVIAAALVSIAYQQCMVARPHEVSASPEVEARAD